MFIESEWKGLLRKISPSFPGRQISKPLYIMSPHSFFCFLRWDSIILHIFSSQHLLNAFGVLRTSSRRLWIVCLDFISHKVDATILILQMRSKVLEKSDDLPRVKGAWHRAAGRSSMPKQGCSLLFSYFSIAVIWHHDQGNLLKKVGFFFWAYKKESYSPLSSWWRTWR